MTKRNYVNRERVKALREGILDVKEPAWGDNLDPDSKNYIYQRSKSYRGNAGPIKNWQGKNELQKALKWKRKLDTGDYTQKELGDALAVEIKDLEKIKKKLGRDFKPGELTEMLLYLNDELKKAGINLRGDIPSKAEYLAAQEIISNLFGGGWRGDRVEYAGYDDEDWEDDEDFEESVKRVRESATSYTIEICDNHRAANRGMGSDTFHKVIVKAADDTEAMKKAFIAKWAVEEDLYRRRLDRATIRKVLNFLEEDYFDDKEELDEVLNYSAEEFAELFDSDDLGFGEAFVCKVTNNASGAVVYDIMLEDEEDWDDEEDWEDDEDFEESVKKPVRRPTRRMKEYYEKQCVVHICDNEAAASRGTHGETFSTVKVQAESNLDALQKALKMVISGYYGEEDHDDGVETIYEASADRLENIWENCDENDGSWDEILESEDALKDYFETCDWGDGLPFVYGVVFEANWILDVDADSINKEKDEIYAEMDHDNPDLMESKRPVAMRRLRSGF